ncbi:MAG: pyridoxamine kinase [Kiritimatiellia bacterium]
MAVDHNRQRKVAVINDYTSFGRCSLGASVPVLAAMKVQCCPVPTAVFTNHTGFARFSFADMTDRMDAYIADWRETGLRFSAIASGYLASERQIDFVRRFVKAFGGDGTRVVIDPVMGDYGKLYSGFKRSVAEGLRALLPIADYLTPNLTEACVLLGRDYNPTPGDGELEEIAVSLCTGRTRGVVVSGVPRAGRLVNYVYTPAAGGVKIDVEKIGPDRSGTGDVFASVILGALVNGLSLEAAVRKAAGFVARAVRVAEEMEIPTTDGLPFEEVLSELWS